MSSCLRPQGLKDGMLTISDKTRTFETLALIHDEHKS